MDVTLISVGIACVFAAIVGGGLKALNVELPVLRRPIQYVLLTVVGVGLFGLGWYVHVQKPPSPPAGIMTTVTSSRSAQGHGYPCAATFTGTIAIAEGQGAVNYTWFAFTTEPMNRSLGTEPRSVHFDAPGTATVTGDILVHEPESGLAYIRVDTPETTQSRPLRFSFTC
jgi:hypothetical protein